MDRDLHWFVSGNNNQRVQKDGRYVMEEDHADIVNRPGPLHRAPRIPYNSVQRHPGAHYGPAQVDYLGPRDFVLERTGHVVDSPLPAETNTFVKLFSGLYQDENLLVVEVVEGCQDGGVDQDVYWQVVGIISVITVHSSYYAFPSADQKSSRTVDVVRPSGKRFFPNWYD